MPDGEKVEQRIRERAYLIWLDEGRPAGRDKEHWDMARAAIEEESKQSSTQENVSGKLPSDSSFGP
jgi:hypothetical protein